MLKQEIVRDLREQGHDVIDVGTDSTDPVDYPDFAVAVANAVLDGQAERGVLICGSGVGASVAANKVRGIRAAICHDTYSAHQGVEHDNMNVLVLGGRVLGEMLAIELVHAFIGAKFSGEPRHVRRLAKIQAIEDEW
jgi:RpiB/LacA/LacB family sugar-phosphate isomerase